ncbi:MAG: histone deacetylase, partial [Balneolaceae bacterium]|nr:histone deacetylase [Balneolaceae bacterium]
RYADGIMTGNLPPKELRKLGLPWSKKLAIRSRLAVQGTINAALMALQDGVAGNLAGGTHHAMSDHGEGFCVFNDVAVAIKVLQQTMWARKILVIDCDVHQGNGTAEILKGNEDVFTFSIHGEKNYPFKKPPSSLDIGLPDGTPDTHYLNTLGDALDEIFDQFDPDLVFYLGGIDPLESDHFGRLALTLNGLYNRDRIVLQKVIGKDKPLVLLLSGGYGPTLKATVEAHALMYKAALELWN